MIKMPSETWSLSPKHTFLNREPGEEFYDKLPYIRNYDQCNSDHITMESGNIYKFYDCKERKKGYRIPNKDDIFFDLIAKQQKEKEQRDTSKKEATKTKK